MRLASGLTRTKFTPLSPSRPTSRAPNSENLFWAEFFFHGRDIMPQTQVHGWSILNTLRVPSIYFPSEDILWGATAPARQPLSRSAIISRCADAIVSRVESRSSKSTSTAENPGKHGGTLLKPSFRKKTPRSSRK